MTFMQLEKRYVEIQAHLKKMSENFPWEVRSCYLSWLAQSYEYANFSTRILALTAGHFPLDKTAHSNRFIKHAAEEKGHERLLMNDAKALGHSITDLPVFPEAEAFHKSLYFWIYQGNPSTIFGWVLALEGFAVINGPQIFERVQKAFGPKASTFLRVHAQEDPDHLEKAFATLKGMPEADFEAICHGLELYSTLYENIYKAIEIKAQFIKTTEAA